MKSKALPITYHSAPNGLRMVHLGVPGAPVGYMGVCIAVGARDEVPGQYGLAHFVEHTIFKGTRRRRSWHIINRMEAVGGELNAYTTKEETVVYSAFPGASPVRAAELIADLVKNSQFPERELDKEREVVADEIDSYLDTPAEAIYDDFEDMLFADNGLGHNILGTRATLEGFTSAVCRDYIAAHYVPRNITAFYAGSMRPEAVFGIIERYFDLADRPVPASTRLTPAIIPAVNITRPGASHQCHTVIGGRVGGLQSPDRFAVALLANILGGPGMNSLLNLALRERRGLVYNVETTTGIFSDCGELVIYYGCDPADDATCRRLTLDVIRSVADGYITPSRLNRARKQYLGQLTLSSTNIESRILGIARATSIASRAMTTADIIASINEVTAADIAAAAAHLTEPTILSLTPR